MICLREQHFGDTDLVEVERQVRVNLEFDMKRRLVDVRDVDDILAADTAPWRHHRRILPGTGSNSTCGDAAGGVSSGRRPITSTSRTGRRCSRPNDGSPAEGIVPRSSCSSSCMDTARAGLGGRVVPGSRGGDDRRRISGYRRRHQEGAVTGRLPEHAMDALTLDEERFLAWAFTKWPEFEAERLVIFGTPAAVAVVELRAAAVPCRCRFPYRV